MTKNEISVIIPVKDAEATLPECLDALTAVADDVKEIILVDDGCRDRSCEIAGRYPKVRIVPTPHESRGVARARNLGARAAVGSVILFIDSDIVLDPRAVEVLQKNFDDPHVDAVVGLLDPESRFRNFASDYKNLWIHYTYLIQPQNTSLFYTSIAAIRRDLFCNFGGFQEAYLRPGLEDTEFGNRLYQAGHPVRRVKDLCALHLKYYSIVDLFRLDYQRAIGLVKIQLRRGKKTVASGNMSSVPAGFIISIVPAALAMVFLLLSTVFLSPRLALAGIGAAGTCWALNGRFLAFLCHQRGLLFFLKSALFLLADSLFLVSGVLAAFIDYFRGKRY